MFIVSKIDLQENKIDIINVVDEDINYDRLVAYESMIKDALQYGEGNSVKNINQGRIEIYIKGVFSSFLRYVYTLHEIVEDEEEVA